MEHNPSRVSGNVAATTRLFRAVTTKYLRTSTKVRPQAQHPSMMGIADVDRLGSDLVLTSRVRRAVVWGTSYVGQPRFPVVRFVKTGGRFLRPTPIRVAADAKRAPRAPVGMSPMAICLSPMSIPLSQTGIPVSPMKPRLSPTGMLVSPTGISVSPDGGAAVRGGYPRTLGADESPVRPHMIPQFEAVVIELSGICNYLPIGDGIFTAGQPSEEQLRGLASNGFEAVVNLGLLDPRYCLPNEAALVAQLGMTYHHIPVIFKKPLLTDYELFCQTMRTLRGQTVLVHCAMNYRVSCFAALYGEAELGWTRERANAHIVRVWQPDEIWSAFLARVRGG